MTKRSDLARQYKAWCPRLFPVLFFAGCVLATATGCNRKPGADVVASVNGKAILRTEMDKEYAALIQQQQQQAPPSAEQADLAKLSVVRACSWLDVQLVFGKGVAPALGNAGRWGRRISSPSSRERSSDSTWPTCVTISAT